LLHVKVKPNTDFEHDLLKKTIQDVQDIIGERRYKAVIEMGENNSSSDGSRKSYVENAYNKKIQIGRCFYRKIIKRWAYCKFLHYNIQTNKSI